MEKQKIQARRANLFFIELIIALLFFSISAVIILRVFAAADNKQHTAAMTEKSIICAQSLAEVYSVSGDVRSCTDVVFDNKQLDSVYEIMLDEDMSPVADDAAVKLTMQETVLSEDAAGRLSELTMTFSTGDAELYSLTCSAYIPLNMQEVAQ